MTLDAFVVMPNHVHGLVGLAPATNAGATVARPSSGISPVVGSLAVAIRSYKAAVTRAARASAPGFAWQRRFHDHVVRDEADLRRIRAYIEHNPAVWDRDRHRTAGPERPLRAR